MQFLLDNNRCNSLINFTLMNFLATIARETMFDILEVEDL